MKNKDEDILLKKFKEIYEYIKNQEKDPDYDYSFYDLKIYALENRPDWFDLINKKEKFRKMISDYLRSAKKKSGKVYNKTRPEATFEYEKKLDEIRSKKNEEYEEKLLKADIEFKKEKNNE